MTPFQKARGELFTAKAQADEHKRKCSNSCPAYKALRQLEDTLREVAVSALIEERAAHGMQGM